MTMTVHDVQQGTNQWHSLRAEHFTASEAPAMMGVSPYLSRDELLKQKALRLVDAEIDSHKAALFQAGHDAEAGYRPIAEAQIDDDLYNVTGTRDVDGLPLLASFDGLTMDRTIGFEHKLWSGKVAAQLADTGEPAPHHYWQLEQQLLVSGARRIMFATSDGTAGRSAWVWYESKPERRAQLIAGWKQFAADLAAWGPAEAKPAPVVGKTPDNLPALLIQVTGAVTASNLPEYKAHALEVFKGINRTLSTDQDFATAENTVKWCADVESRLAAAKEHALSQTATIDELFRTIDDISAEARRTRLELDKLVKARKEEIRGEIVAGGIAALREHIAQLNAAMPVAYMPQVPADFAGAIKGKRTVESLRSAVNDELARAKIAASEIANRIHANVKTLQASGLVVHDAAALVLKAPDDLAAIIANRVTAEQQRQEADRERIRKEEADRADREAREKLAAEERAAQAAITQAAKAETLHPAVAADLGTMVREQHAEAVAGLDAQQAIGTAQRAAAAGAVVVPLPAAAPADRAGTPTLKLGSINERLGGVLTISADGLRALGFEVVARERGACLYHEADFPLILAALVRHIEGVQAKAAA
ncbi:YqaJ viral recombinase family protein [Acidovorax kalamii]|uniref:YqaJ viral recombinase family protein n=1 Tax=Acidovorax kalamii TaxID=2004485 RepID=UPI002090F2E9|nr:YqaJ viral recombinase family protein [Acidovorax kalamii]MCO5355111.1 YqaJ viral recombinase family protein [Acidovorax kalamii]